MDNPNHYELLCVTPEATADEIRSAYRRLIRVYHPDVATEAGQAMTQRLNEAQRELLDPDLRASYDRTLRVYSTRPTMTYNTTRSRGYSAPNFSASTSGTGRPAGGWAPAEESAAQWPAAPRAKVGTFSAARYRALMVGLVASGAAIVFATAVVFIVCYSGELTIFSPRFVPPVVVAIAWLVGALSKPPKLLIALMVIGAALWPLAAAGVEPFSLLAGVWAPVLPCLTLIVVAVVVFRTVAPKAAEQSRLRPLRPGRSRASFAA